MVTISASVGQNGRNKQPDVLAIQHALNGIPPAKGGPLPPLKEDGIAGPKTIGAIVKFQRANSGLIVDGRVDAAGPTLACINSLAGGHLPLAEVSGDTIERLKQFFRDFVFDVLGLKDDSQAGDTGTAIIDGLMELIVDMRKDARDRKDWAASDKIRDSLKEIGVQLKDSKEGTSWVIE